MILCGEIESRCTMIERLVNNENIKKVDMPLVEKRSKIGLIVPFIDDVRQEIDEWSGYYTKYEDEKDNGGFWDYAGMIAERIGFAFRENDDDVVYADEWGQEAIYSYLKWGDKGMEFV